MKLVYFLMILNSVYSSYGYNQISYLHSTNFSKLQQFYHHDTILNHNLLNKPDDAPLVLAINLGTRLSQWLAYENSQRSSDQQLYISTKKEVVSGNNIESPVIYSLKTISNDLNDFLKNAPVDFVKILNSQVPFPPQLPIDEATFIKWAQNLNYVYIMSIRYSQLIPYKEEYIKSDINDVRGYYFFHKYHIKPEMLTPTDSLSPSMLTKVLESLNYLCKNEAKQIEKCDNKIQQAAKDNQLDKLLSEWLPIGAKVWESYFVIPDEAVRKDVHWENDTLYFSFQDPENDKYLSYLKNNIEDEFRFNNWSLKLTFGKFSKSPRLVAKAGTLTTANGLGGNEINIDSNISVDELEQKWVIRHEFGHILGLPDCYVEFYDTKLDAFVYYELDFSDLMCSENGKMNQRIYEQLKIHYSNQK